MGFEYILRLSIFQLKSCQAQTLDDHIDNQFVESTGSFIVWVVNNESSTQSRYILQVVQSLTKTIWCHLLSLGYAK